MQTRASRAPRSTSALPEECRTALRLADPVRGCRALRRRRRAAGARRPQRLGQVDASEDRRRRRSSPTAASASSGQGATVRYLPQEPDLSGFHRRLAFVEAGLAPGDDRSPRALSARGLGLTGDEAPQPLSGGEARRAALARALAPEPDILHARRADQPPRPAGDRVAGRPSWRGCARPSSWSAMTGDFFETSVARNGLARPRHDPPARPGLRRVRGVARRDARAARRRDRHKLDRKIARRGRLAALWRDRAPQAQPGAASRLCMRCGSERREQPRAPGKVNFTVTEAELSGKLVIEAKTSPSSSAAGRSSRSFSTASCAATGSASSGPTAPARRRSSSC